MFYLALTFWLLVGLLESFAIFRLWEGLVRPRYINIVLLPGTLVSETAHFLAALLTGGSVPEAAVISDKGVAEEAGGGVRPGIPVLGPLLTAMLPILAALGVIYLLYRTLDNSVMSGLAGYFASPPLAQELTWQWQGWFRMAHGLLDLAERLIDALPFRHPLDNWPSWLFVYLTACLAIRMVPLRGSLRSGMAALVLIGLVCGLIGLIPAVDKGFHNAWDLLSYVVALLTVLLLLTLLVRGLAALAILLTRGLKTGGGRASSE